MLIKSYHVDAFTEKVFSGNPAVVCILEKMLSDDLLFSIAKENNLPVTAFIVQENNFYHIRWITPEYELPLCGHGTLAASFVIFNFLQPSWNKIIFRSQHEQLEAHKNGEFMILNFPARKIEKCDNIPYLNDGLGSTPIEIYQYHDRCLAIYQSQAEIKNLKPNIETLKKMKHVGIIVSARGDDCDIVSRTFYPKKTIFEDAATGASHCLLIPYWRQHINKKEFHCRQLSAREGEMYCQFTDDRILIKAQAVLFKKAEIYLPT